MATVKRARVVRESMDSAIQRLERDVRRMEAAHGCSSESAFRAVRAGRMAETPEVAEWLTAFQKLESLKAGARSANGTRTKTTG